MSWCLISILIAVVLLLVNILMLTLSQSNFSMEERAMHPLARFSGFTKDFPSDNSLQLYLSRLNTSFYFCAYVFC